jgi:imidazolonepropionase
MAEGVTTLEIKSGYGLSSRDEARCLAVARRTGPDLPLTVRTTYPGRACAAARIRRPRRRLHRRRCAWLPRLHAAGLVDAVDAFCENIGFSRRRPSACSTPRGAGPAGQAACRAAQRPGRRALAARFGALSCDHLEHLSAEGIAAMRAAGTVAVLLPGAFYFLRETRLPPVAALRAAGVPMALATDHNPGSSPGLSLLLMLNMACTLFRLTPEEAVRRHRACGAGAGPARPRPLAAGQRADFVRVGRDHPRELAYWFGHNPCRRVVVRRRHESPDDDTTRPTPCTAAAAAADQPAACRHADPGRPAPRYVRARLEVEDTDWHLEPAVRLRRRRWAPAAGAALAAT